MTSERNEHLNKIEAVNKRGWSALCGYTHTGLIQLGRRFRDHDVKPAYRDSEIVEITTTVSV